MLKILLYPSTFEMHPCFIVELSFFKKISLGYGLFLIIIQKFYFVLIFNVAGIVKKVTPKEKNETTQDSN